MSDILNDEKIEGGGFLRKSCLKSSSFLKRRNMIPRSMNSIFELNETDGGGNGVKDKTDLECDELMISKGSLEIILNSDDKNSDNDNEENKESEKVTKSFIRNSNTKNLQIPADKKEKSKRSTEFDENEIENISTNLDGSFAVKMTESVKSSIGHEDNKKYFDVGNTEDTERTDGISIQQIQNKFLENNIPENVMEEDSAVDNRIIESDMITDNKMRHPSHLTVHQSFNLVNPENQATKGEKGIVQEEYLEGQEEKMNVREEEEEEGGEEEVILSFFFHISFCLYPLYQSIHSKYLTFALFFLFQDYNSDSDSDNSLESETQDHFAGLPIAHAAAARGGSPCYISYN